MYTLLCLNVQTVLVLLLKFVVQQNEGQQAPALQVEPDTADGSL